VSDLSDHSLEDSDVKVVVILIVLVGLAVLAVKIVSLLTMEKPSEQGQKVRGALKVGMSWTEVIEIAGEPQAWKEGGCEVGLHFDEEYLPETRDDIAKWLEEDDLRLGFSLLFRYSLSVSFGVNFDRKGNLTSIIDQMKMSELLDVDNE
jgi:hypothetical protein